MNKPPHNKREQRDELRDSLKYLIDEHDTADDMDDLEIAALVSGELEGDERAAAIQRLICSPEAARKYRILSDLHLEAQEPAKGWLQPYRMLGVAATLLLGVGFAIQMQGPTDQFVDADAIRAPMDRAIWPTNQAPVGDLPIRFQWASQPGAVQYRVRLLDEQANYLWQSDWVDASQASMLLDSEDGVRLQNGRYFWVVDVDGRVPQRELGPYWFVYGEN